MLKPTGPKIGAVGKMVKLTSDQMVKLENGKIVKMVERVGASKMVKNVKPPGPKIDTSGKRRSR